jgi:tetratricopeptide (TPR) repeat protein
MAQDAAATEELPAVRLGVARALGRLFGSRRQWPEAQRELAAAVAAAEAGGDPDELDESLRDLVLVLVRAGDAVGAKDAIAAAGDAAGDGVPLDGIRAAALCAVAVAEGRPEDALEAGWAAIELLQPESTAYARVLIDLGSSLRQLGLPEAADACELLVSHGESPERLVEEARIRKAVASATAAGDASQARARLTEALSDARRARLGLMVPAIEDRLASLDSGARAPTERSAPSDGTLAIADRIASLGRELVASGS